MAANMSKILPRRCCGTRAECAFYTNFSSLLPCLRCQSALKLSLSPSLRGYNELGSPRPLMVAKLNSKTLFWNKFFVFLCRSFRKYRMHFFHFYSCSSIWFSNQPSSAWEVPFRQKSQNHWTLLSTHCHPLPHFPHSLSLSPHPPPLPHKEFSEPGFTVKQTFRHSSSHENSKRWESSSFDLL